MSHVDLAQVGAKDQGEPVRIGVVGTGFISTHFTLFVEDRAGFQVSRILTRRPIDHCRDHPGRDRITDSLEDLLAGSDIVLECSGDPIYATDIVDAACRAGRPVVTVNSEFHVTAGSYFVDKGLVSEAEGDQPGSQAALKEEAVELGFRPLVYGNMKGFQNFTPTPEDMAYWSERQGISVPMTTSFTDGTKIQFEQALVANGCGATFAQAGMLGIATDDLREGAEALARHAGQIGEAISDYIISPKVTHGVFIVGEHDARQQPALQYYKMGEGPYYTLLKPNILVHLEVLKTIRRVACEGRVLLDNARFPLISVSTVAKRRLEPGTKIEHGIGSFDVRGVGLRIVDAPGHMPIGLMAKAVVTRLVEAGETLALTDVEIPDSLAYRAWQEVESRVLARDDDGKAKAGSRA